MTHDWYRIANADDVPSPALLVYPDRVAENIRRMVAAAGGPARLRPHVKTHKLHQVSRMHLERGITKFKCATIAEAEMLARCGAPDVLLAYPIVGPNVARFLRLVRAFPGTRFAALADDAGAIRNVGEAAAAAGIAVDLFLDLDTGMHRTGIAAGPAAVDLYRLIAAGPGVRPAGLHAYDGHIRDTDLGARTRACDEAFAPVAALRGALVAAGLPVPAVVVGGTPSFAVHCRRPDIECSPGTSVFWDRGYETIVPDLDFLPAVLVLTRVVSRPAGNRLCLDLGHKAIASEVPPPRVHLFGLEDARQVGHSEEHLVLETPRAAETPVGTVFYGIPWHVCPTVALHHEAVVVENGLASSRWPVTARARQLTI